MVVFAIALTTCAGALGIIGPQTIWFLLRSIAETADIRPISTDIELILLERRICLHHRGGRNRNEP